MELRTDEGKLARVARRHGLKFVILHGSAVNGGTHPESDLDVAVVGVQSISLQQQIELFGALAEVFGETGGRELDVKALHRVDPLFRYEVVRDGKLLYGDPTAYEEFKAFAARAYDDARPLLALERALSRKFQRHLNTLARALPGEH